MLPGLTLTWGQSSVIVTVTVVLMAQSPARKTPRDEDNGDVLLQGETMEAWEQRQNQREREAARNSDDAGRAVHRGDSQWREYYDPHLGID